MRLRPLIAAAGLLAALAAAGPAQAMTFRLVSVGGDCGQACPQVIAAEGEIERNSAETFAAFVRQRIGTGRLRNIIFLHSPGGNVVGAIKLGALFRRVGSAVVVAQAREGQGVGADASFLSARCMSACVYALMGGKRRVIPPQSQLGVHRTSSFQFVGKDPANTDPGYQRIKTPEALVAALTAYTKSMGVSTAVIDAAQATPHETIRVLTRQELAKWRLGVEKL
ncbi:MAG: hypothetical protein JNK46_14155 [Methylobacteriaceae bacterium]|nr:hypothetical protein [Methylobacteriaceae bacterium]